MLDIAWPELMVIGAVALVAIGPKDLPKVMRTMGRWAGKARRMAHEIQRTFEQVSYEAEVAEKLKKEETQPQQDWGGSPPLAGSLRQQGASSAEGLVEPTRGRGGVDNEKTS